MKYRVLFLLTFFAHASFAAPSLSTVTPSSGFLGATLNLTITGNGFVAGQTEVRFSGAGILVNGARVVNASSIVANVTLLGDPGTRQISVLSGGTSNSVPFEILSSPVSNSQNGVVNYFTGSRTFHGTRDARGTDARFFAPAGIWSDGTSLFVTDNFGATLRKISIDTAGVTTLAGVSYQVGSVDGIGSNARLNSKAASPVWGDGLNVYTLENCRIRKTVIATGAVTTLVGGPCAHEDGPPDVARLYLNVGLTGDGSFLYTFNPGIATGTPSTPGPPGPSYIRVISLATGEVSSVPGPRWPVPGDIPALVSLWAIG